MPTGVSMPPPTPCSTRKSTSSAEAVREAAERRGYGEDDDRGQQDAPAAEPVAQPARGRDENCEADQVRDDDGVRPRCGRRLKSRPIVGRATLTIVTSMTEHEHRHHEDDSYRDLLTYSVAHCSDSTDHRVPDNVRENARVTALSLTAPLRLSEQVVADPPVVLAPMAGITNTAFRRLCREQLGGGGLFISEMITTRALVERNQKTLRMIRFEPDETPRSLQLYGIDPAIVGAAVRMIVEEDLADHVDLKPEQY